VPTERERHVLAQGLPVYRVLYTRNGQPPPAAELLQQRLAETLEQNPEAADNPANRAAPP
jgi:tRNA (guanine-N7-)-methyltransferase